MSASFVAGSSQYLRQSAWVGVLPFTVAAWVLPFSASATATVWAQHRDDLDDGYFMGIASSTWNITAHETSNYAATFGTVTANQWAFLLGRFITATNRRGSVLQYDGSIAHGQNTTSHGVSSWYHGIGALQSPVGSYWDGYIAEWWMADSDIQADGAELNPELLRQLARGGPFSVPHVAKDLLAYHPFIASVDGRTEVGQENWSGAGSGPVRWTNNGGVTLGPHPPLPTSYVRRWDRQVIVPIG